MRQDMVKEMKNDFEEDRKKLKQVYLVRFLMTAAMLLLLIFNFDHWMNVIVNFLSLFVRLSVLNCLPFSHCLLIFQEIRRDFQAEAERREFEAELKNTYLIHQNICEYSLKYLFKGGVEEEREGEGDGI